MLCPICGSSETEVFNSRPTKQSTQIWRRRRCLPSQHTFSSYERLDMGYLTIIKPQGHHEPYNRSKLLLSLSVIQPPNTQADAVALTDTIEASLIRLNKSTIYRSQLMQVITRTLKNYDYSLLLRFVSQHELFGSTRLLNQYLKAL